jgi:pilus assembly protein CpaB
VQNRRTLIVVVSVLLAVVAGVIAWLYVNNADQRATNKAQTESIYVAKAAIPAGTTGEAAAASIGKQEYLKDSVPADAIVATTDLSGKVASYPIAAGLPITAAQFSAPGTTGSIQATLDAKKGYEAVAIPLTGVQAVNGLIAPGDYVNLIISGSSTTPTASGAAANATANGARAAYFMQNVHVLGVGTTLAGAPAPTSGSGTAATTTAPTGALILEVTPINAERIIEAQTTNQTIFATLIPTAYQPPTSATPTIGVGNLLDPNVTAPETGLSVNPLPTNPTPNPKKVG